jgi:O-antigen biosynthesis protein
MMMPTQLAQSLAGFDEDYFMYGEDIDLSYKVQKAGKKNYYLADVTAIHFKGESTKKNSLKYVKMFYNAMIIFAQKHLSSSKQSLYIPLIKLAIFARAALDVVIRTAGKLVLPLCDALLMLLALFQVKRYWLAYVKPDTDYTIGTLATFFTAYIAIWLCSLFLYGAYDTPLRKSNIVRGMAVGAVITLALYGLLPEQARFSRGVSAMGAVAGTVLIWLLRSCLQTLGVAKVAQQSTNAARLITVTTHTQSASEIADVLHKAGVHSDVVGNVNSSKMAAQTDLGSFDQLASAARLHAAHELIFAYPDVSYKQMIQSMSSMPLQFNYKMFATGIPSIIGSNDRNTAGDLYASDKHFSIAKASSRRSKRTFDIVSSLLMILLAPLLFWFCKNKAVYQAALQVFSGTRTWVSYIGTASNINLPQVKVGVCDIGLGQQLTEASANTLNMRYARHYSWHSDRAILLQSLF